MFSYVIVSVCDLFFLRRRGNAPLRSRILPAMAKFLFRIAHTIHRFVCSTQFSTLTKRATKLRYTSMFSYVIVSVCDLFFLRRRGNAPLRSRILPAMAKFLFRIAHTIHRFVCSTQFSTLTKRFCQTARLLNESILYYNRNSESVKQFSRPIYGNFILPLKNK